MAFVLLVGDSRVLRWREDRFKLDLPVSVHSLSSADFCKIQTRVDQILDGKINPYLHLYPKETRPCRNKRKTKQNARKGIESCNEKCTGSTISSPAQGNPQSAQFKSISKLTRGNAINSVESVSDSSNNDNIKAIVVFGFLYDFLFRIKDLTNKSGKGVTKAITSTSTHIFRGLLERVATASKEWQRKVPADCKIIWTFPYPFDLLQYNSAFLERVGQEPLSSREENTMNQYTKQFLCNLMTLRRMWLNLMPAEMMFFDLNLLDGSTDTLECNKIKCPRKVASRLLFPSPSKVRAFNCFLNTVIQSDTNGSKTSEQMNPEAETNN